jgi:hypothetical protein
MPLRLITNQYVDIQKNESIGLRMLSTALHSYLEELEVEERKAQEEVERAKAQDIVRGASQKSLRERWQARQTREKEAQEKAKRKRKEQELPELIAKAEMVGRELNEGKPIAREETKAPSAAKAEVAMPEEKERHDAYVTVVPAEKSNERAAVNVTNQQIWFGAGLILVGWIFASVISYYMLPDFNRVTSVYAIGGFFTAILLRGMGVLSNLRQVVLMTLGWTVGGAIGSRYEYAIGYSIGGAIGGLGTACALWSEYVLIDGKLILGISLLWSLGGLLGGLLSLGSLTLSVAFMGAYSGFFTIRRISREKRRAGMNLAAYRK